MIPSKRDSKWEEEREKNCVHMAIITSHAEQDVQKYKVDQASEENIIA